MAEISMSCKLDKLDIVCFQRIIWKRFIPKSVPAIADAVVLPEIEALITPFGLMTFRTALLVMFGS